MTFDNVSWVAGTTRAGDKEYERYAVVLPSLAMLAGGNEPDAAMGHFQRPAFSQTARIDTAAGVTPATRAA